MILIESFLGSSLGTHAIMGGNGNMTTGAIPCIDFRLPLVNGYAYPVCQSGTAVSLCSNFYIVASYGINPATILSLIIENISGILNQLVEGMLAPLIAVLGPAWSQIGPIISSLLPGIPISSPEQLIEYLVSILLDPLTSFLDGLASLITTETDIYAQILKAPVCGDTNSFVPVGPKVPLTGATLGTGVLQFGGMDCNCKDNDCCASNVSIPVQCGDQLTIEYTMESTTTIDLSGLCAFLEPLMEIFSTISSLIGSILGALAGIGIIIPNPLPTDFCDFLQTIMNAITAGIHAIVDPVVQMITSAIDNFKSTLDGLLNGMGLGFLASIIDPILTCLRDEVSYVIDQLIGMLQPIIDAICPCGSGVITIPGGSLFNIVAGVGNANIRICDVNFTCNYPGCPTPPPLNCATCCACCNCGSCSGNTGPSGCTGGCGSSCGCNGNTGSTGAVDAVDASNI